LKKTIIPFLIAILVANYGNYLSGQEVVHNNQWFARHPVEIAIGNFSVGMPFSGIFISKFYPLATLGTEFYYRTSEHSRIYQSARIGGYYNKYNTSAIFINTEIGYRFTFGFGFFADANLGIGYAHLFRPNAIYKMNGSGDYEQVSDWGKPSCMADYSMSAGYDFSKKLQMPFSLFLRYGNYIQLFYNPDIPALPQNSFQIGTRFFIK